MVHMGCGPVTRSPSQGWLCRLASFASIPPRMQPKPRGSDSSPGWDCLPLNMPAFDGRTMARKLDVLEFAVFFTACLDARDNETGQWESYDITLIGRNITVVPDGVTPVDNREIPGITGLAIDSREGAPGPLLIQGDHTGGMKFTGISRSRCRRSSRAWCGAAVRDVYLRQLALCFDSRKKHYRGRTSP